MAYDEHKTTARWQDDTLLVRWYGSQYEDEAGQWDDTQKRFIYDGYEDTYNIRVPEDKKPEASVMVDIMQAYQHGY